MHFTYMVTLMGPGGKQQPDILILILILVFTHLLRGQNGLVVASHHVGRGGGGWANQDIMASSIETNEWALCSLCNKA
jgi:hypothetical protein